MEGQLYPEERKFLHDAVLEAKADHILEVGTWKGGGSTWQIAEAIKKLGRGHLYTCETNDKFFAEASEIYVSHRRVHLYHEESTSLIRRLINSIDFGFVFFDGPNDPDHSFGDFKLLEPSLKSGAYFCMHDWDICTRPCGTVAKKAERLRPHLESLETWEILRTLTAPESVGIVLARKK